MVRSFLLASLFLLFETVAFPQLFQNYSIAPAFATRSYVPMDMGAGMTAYACDRAFGFDSSYVEVMFTAADQSVIDAACYKTSASLTFFDHAAKLDDGVLVSGLSFPSYPMLLKTGNTGAVQWYSTINNLQNGQDQLIRILPRGSDFTVYTYPGGTYAHGTYRIEGEGSGTTFTGREITAAAYFRIYEAVPTADPLVHMVVGTANDDADPTHLQTMVMKTDATGAQWMKLYEMGTSGVQTQDLYGILPLADGNYLCSGYYTTGGSGFQGVLLKIDASGTVIWCKQYADVSGGLFLSHAHELYSGDVVVSGFNGAYQGILLKVDPSGDPQWTKLYAADRLGAFFTSGSLLKVTGLASLIDLDANGEGCDLVGIANVTAAAYMPAVSSITVTNAPFVPATTPLTAAVRPPALGWTPGCVWSGIQETSASAVITAYPIPTEGVVHLGEAGQVAEEERVRLLTPAGKLLRETVYGSGVDLSSETPGTYAIELPASHRHVLVVKQ